MLKAGAASVDITPADVRSTYMAGFGMGRRARGVHLPLRASAVYVASGDAELVLVSLDLVGLLKVWIDRIRDAVTEVAGDRVVVACTHTHAGPDTMGYWGPSILKVFPRSDGKNPAYMHRLVDLVAGCIDDAVQGARAVTMRLVSFEGDEGWTRNDRAGGGRYDHVVAAAFDADTHRVATVVNYASHPEALWEHNRLLSPDFVGPLRQRIGQRTGGEVVYLSGPLGAMLTPDCHAGERDVPDRIAFVEEMGRAVADATVDALADAVPIEAAPLVHDARSVVLGNENWRFRLLERLNLVDVVTRGREVATLLHTVRLGELSLVGAPGEVCPELGERIHRRMPGSHRMVVSLCEDEFGYVLEPRMFDDDEYGYEVTMSLGRGTADAIVDGYGDFLTAESDADPVPDGPAPAAGVSDAVDNGVADA